MWPLWTFIIIMVVWATTPWWPDHCPRLPFMYKPKQNLEEPVLPSELDDWDAEFTRLTGKTIWQARCEADPNLCMARMQLDSAMNNPNPYYQAQFARFLQMNEADRLKFIAQGGFSQQQSQLGNTYLNCHSFGSNEDVPRQDVFRAALGGLGNSLGGLFH